MLKIQQFFKNRQISHVESGSLRLGQIVRGNIVKLFSNNRAQIQLGSQQLTAQLQASLAVGKSYHFQIMQVEDDLIHLKVLSELGEDPRTNMTNLLRNLGIQPSRHHINFMQTIINERIPFQQTDLINALNMLSRSSNKSHAQQILTQMLQKKLPINETIFQALSITNRKSFTKVVNEFSHMLRNNSSPNASQVQQVIRYIQGSTPFVREETLSNILNNRSFNHFLQSMGIISPPVTESFNTISDEEPFSTQLNVRQQFNSMNLQLFNNILNNLLDHKDLIVSRANKLLDEWVFLPNSPKQMPMTNFHNLRQITNELIVPVLAQEQQQYVQTLLHNEPSQLLRLHQFLTYLTNDESYTMASEVRSFINYEHPKNQFLSQISHIINDLGLSYENNIANDQSLEYLSTLKPLLLQFINEQDAINHERAQQLLHFINGLQIQSVQESPHFIQANIIVPGERLALHNDIHLEFESKKTADGKINPDFCRILFYLDLAHLQETIIDMHIQNRHVSITVFNEKSSLLSRITNRFKPKLEAGLNSLQYDLTTITCKPLLQKDEQLTKEQSMPKQSSYEGIDFRI